MKFNGKNNSTRKRSARERLSRVAFGGTLIIVLIVGSICTFNAIKWVNKPFAGFLLNERMILATIGRYNWTGTQGNLKDYDKILSANGNIVRSMNELEEVVRRTRIGDPVLYRVERGGKVVEVEVSTMRFNWVDLLMTFGITFVAGITYMFIGSIVFVMKPDIKVSRIFLIACFFLCLWSITIFDMQSTHFGFIRLYLLAGAFIPAAFIHFSFYFPRPQRFILSHPRLQILPYVLSLMLIIPMEFLYPHNKFIIFYNLVLLYMVVSALVILYPVMLEYFKPTSALSRQRAKVALVGLAIAFPLPTMAYASQAAFDSFLGMTIQTNFLALPLIIFPASIAYAIAKHNLFDVDVYIKRAVGYAIMTAIIVSSYMLVSIPLNVWIGHHRVVQSKAFPILFTLAVILIFNPLRDRVQGFVDRVFFRKEYDYGGIIEKMGTAMTSLLDLGQILKELATTFIEDMFIDTSSVMLLSPTQNEYSVYLAAGEKRVELERIKLKRNDTLIKALESNKRELTKYDILEDPNYKSVSEECTKNFETLHASLMVPLVFQDEMIGVLNLGEKKSGKFFSREDIDLLNTLANQSAVAIENARLFQESIEKQRMEEELAIARDLQASMLPADCPTIEGFEIAAYSLSAREVGGDFYDFIDMEKDKVGMVIGDVTGKSVSGALVMSASRSVFRMLSEENLSVGEIMIRANRRTKKDIKSGMFVALLYAVLNSKDRTLSLCSAGQTQPIHWSSETGESTLVETKGDTFPLGILEDVGYQETRLQLASGDKIVLYTDGIVEAMNHKEEIFGFERLLEIVQEASAMSADAILKKILYQVNEFAGAVAQHDDLTVIVISAD